jgi:beta-lactamase superfamily II metal-dependent hydrolase
MIKVKVFQSGSGDCLLLSGSGRNILVDGGFIGTFTDNTRPALAEIARRGEKLDLVCVSHIDSDHISGILQLMDDILAWRVFDFQNKQKNGKFKEPKFDRLPEIAEIWHNGFETQIGETAGDFESTVGMQVQASILSGNWLLAEAGQNLINGQQQAIELAHMIDPALLNIPLNTPTNGEPIVLLDSAPAKYKVGEITLHLLGPFKEDLDKLHQEWTVWLKANQRKLRSLQEQAGENARRLGLNEEAALAQTMQMLAAELGNRTEVTTPNLASITFLAEENGRLVLMTGDAHANEILKGLRLHQFLPAEGGTMHINVLKIQHHGAEANIDEAFCKAVTADHYIFCGNGDYDNPELEVVELVVNSRVGEGADTGENPIINKPFTLWFNSSEAAAGTELRAEHMRKVREKVEELVKEREDKISFKFLEGEPSFEIEL